MRCGKAFFPFSMIYSPFLFSFLYFFLVVIIVRAYATLPYGLINSKKLQGYVDWDVGETPTIIFSKAQSQIIKSPERQVEVQLNLSFFEIQAQFLKAKNILRRYC